MTNHNLAEREKEKLELLGSLLTCRGNAEDELGKRRGERAV